MKLVRSTTVGTRKLLRVPTAARPSGRTALVGFVAALVVGILGMHALASHGPTPTPTPTPAVAAASGDSHHGHTPPVTSGASTSAGADEADTGPGSGHDMGTMTMLCAVMLAAAAMTLLVLLAIRIVRPRLPAAFHPAVVLMRAALWVRGTGPPHAWAFSVIRC